MAYTTTELITRSWYLSDIVGRGFQTVSGDQLSEGLEMLNEVISFKTADQRLIPYYVEYSFPAVVGQENYTINNLILCETLAYNINNVRYEMNLVGRHEYYGSARANAINSLPFMYYVERKLNGSNIAVYFSPQQEFDFIVHGKFSLSNVTIGQNLLLTLDQYYIDYLKYALAEYMCQQYGTTFPAQKKAILDKMEQKIFDISPIDFSMQKKTVFQYQSGNDLYAQVNLGNGWTAP